MRKVIAYTLLSVDGVFEDPAWLGFMRYRDDAMVLALVGLRGDAHGSQCLRSVGNNLAVAHRSVGTPAQ